MIGGMIQIYGDGSMARKVFLSFLGTNPYLECNYGPVKNVVFIQEALVKEHCANWDENDKIYIFLTEDAEQKNWRNGGNFEKGLQQRLQDLAIKPEVVPVTGIPSGKSQDELWDIFEKMFDVLEEEDEVIYDITHSFRSLPMLGMALLNYAKFLKHISVAGIYYGAFEVLGNFKTVEKMSIEERNAPVFDLTALSVLQDWSAAAEGFEVHGSMKQMITITDNDATQIFRGGGNKAHGNILRNLNKHLIKSEEMISLIRAEQIKEGQIINELGDEIQKIGDQNSVVLPPFQKILARVKKSTQSFAKEHNYDNLYEILKFYLDKNMLAEASALSREWPISYVLNRFYPERVQDSDLREAISGVMRVFAQKKDDLDQIRDTEQIPEVFNRMCEDYQQYGMESTWIKISQQYDKLLSMRNNFLHCGYSTDDAGLRQWRTRFKEMFELLKKIDEDERR